MSLTDENLIEAFKTLTQSEQNALRSLLVADRAGVRTPLQCALLRRLRRKLKRAARAGKEKRK